MMSVTGHGTRQGTGRHRHRHRRAARLGDMFEDALRTKRSWVTKLPEGWGGSSGKTIGRGVVGIIVGGVVVALFDVGMAHGRW